MNSKSERFFSWVWRINGLIVLVVASLALVGLGVLSFGIGIFTSRDAPQTQVTDVAGANLVAEDLKFGGFRVIQGTDFLYAELATPSRYIGSGSSDGFGTARNLLFFDTKSKKAHWLFENTDNDILSWKIVFNEPRRNMTESKQSKLFAVGFVLQLADHVEGAKADRPRSLVFVSPDGKDVLQIVDSIDSQLGQYHIDSETVLIFYVRDGSVNVLDLDTFNAVVRSDLPLSVEQ